MTSSALRLLFIRCLLLGFAMSEAFAQATEVSARKLTLNQEMKGDLTHTDRHLFELRLS